MPVQYIVTCRHGYAVYSVITKQMTSVAKQHSFIAFNNDKDSTNIVIASHSPPLVV
jgi:hypothetical protein